MDTQTWAEIRRLKEVERLSEREIARRLVISRGKVRRALDGLPTQGSRRNRGSKLDTFRPIIEEILAEYPKLSGVRIFEKLKMAGYLGGISILRNYLVNQRGQHREAYVRYETAPGEQAQVDWGYFDILPFQAREGERYLRKIYFFVMVLSYSRKIYVEFTTSQSLEAFLECHRNAFRYFGGVPQKILYDNLRSVVISRHLKHIQFNQKFLVFAGYYLFTPQACGVAKPNEKGKVESGVGYVKKNFLAGRGFRDFADLEIQAKEWLKQANQRVHGTTKEVPEERWQKEKEHLLHLPAEDYDVTLPIRVKAYHDCYLRFESNYYSVPAKYILLPLTLRANKYEIKIFYQHNCIASHQRSYGKNQRVDDSRHFKELLKIKKAARDSKLRDRFLSLSPACAAYFEGLLGLEKDLKAELKVIMQQVDLHGTYEVISAIEKALAHKAFGALYIKNIIAQQRAKRQERIVAPLSLAKYPHLEEIEVEPRNLDCYREEGDKNE